jgi:hypothetical protein
MYFVQTRTEAIGREKQIKSYKGGVAFRKLIKKQLLTRQMAHGEIA